MGPNTCSQGIWKTRVLVFFNNSFEIWLPSCFGIPLPFIAPACKCMFVHDCFFIAILPKKNPDSQPTTSQIGGQIGNQELASADCGVTWRDDLLSI